MTDVSVEPRAPKPAGAWYHEVTRAQWMGMLANLRFPTLRLLAGHACYPYYREAMVVACRHEHVYVSPDMYQFQMGQGYEPAPGIEVLTPDFQGRFASLRVVLEARPDVFNHNVETVPRLYPRVRRGADIGRSLGLLAAARTLDARMTTKSGFMLGLGEREEEVLELLARMRAADVDIVTIGQYLRPSRQNLPVEEYVHPAVFERYREAGEAMGFRHVFAGPFVRSSYRAEEALAASGP